MKFTDGNWMMQPGAQPHYATELRDTRIEADGSLILFVATRRIQHRGDTLQGPLLTIRINSPMPGVIRVRIEHDQGKLKRGPASPIEPNLPPFNPEITNSVDPITVTSGRMRAVVQKGGQWCLRFETLDGELLTQSGFRGIGYIDWTDKGRFIHEQLSLGVGGLVYGLGERFTALVRNGQVVENWNRDGGTGSDQAYKSVPFYLTNQGYGVLVNETGPVSFEVASEKVSRVQFSLPAESLDYCIIHGPSPKAVLERLTSLTGKPALPPAWSFGLWLTTSFTTNYNEETVSHFIDGMAERDLPLHVFHFDCFWMREFEWCNFQWDPEVFPDPAAMLQRLKARGLHICVWINPYIGQKSPLFAEAAKRNYLIRKTNGDVWQSDQWQPGMAIVDFTNPAACEWYAGYLRRLAEMGVDSFKTDFGERIPTEVVYHDGSDPHKMHNHYSVIYNEVVFHLLEELRGKGEAILFARSSHTSGQRFPVHWGGDCDSTFESMAESLRGGLSLGLSGFGFWSHDIGGFEGLPPASLYKRWLAFGLMSSHSRLHGSSSYRVPWLYDEEACDVLRHFTRLKCRLMPYLFQCAVEARDKGLPVMRAMLLEFPNDPACEYLDRQYMLGDSLLVAPVFSESGKVRYYLPDGNWTNLQDRSTRSGPGWVEERVGFLQIPLFVRQNSLLAVGTVDHKPDYNYPENCSFAWFQPMIGTEAVCIVPDLKGDAAQVIHARFDGESIEIECAQAAREWDMEISGLDSPKSVEGGTLQSVQAKQILVRKNKNTKRLRIRLE